jgi:pyridoxamine 5'-phosphate oxidase-like protein
MTALRTGEERKRDVMAVLEGQGQMWLATSRDGRPHAIGVSAWWDGADLVVATVGSSLTARNLRDAQAGTLIAGSPDDAVVIDVQLVESMPAQDADEVATGFSSAMGWDPRDVGEGWDFFRLRPSRIQAFRGYDEIEGRDVMRQGRWLA